MKVVSRVSEISCAVSSNSCCKPKRTMPLSISMCFLMQRIAASACRGHVRSLSVYPPSFIKGVLWKRAVDVSYSYGHGFMTLLCVSLGKVECIKKESNCEESWRSCTNMGQTSKFSWWLKFWRFFSVLKSVTKSLSIIWPGRRLRKWIDE